MGEQMDIFKVFTFEAAHQLPNVPAGHSGRLHGHSFYAEVHVRGDVGPKTGWVLDFAHCKKAFKPLFEQFDHHDLNESERLTNPRARTRLHGSGAILSRGASASTIE